MAETEKWKKKSASKNKNKIKTVDGELRRYWNNRRDGAVMIGSGMLFKPVWTSWTYH